MILKPVYYIHGSDDYLVEGALTAIKAASLTGGFASMNYHVYEGRTLNASDVVSTASTLPAFSQKRLIVIKGAEAIKAAEAKSLIPYVNDPLDTTCLVFVSFEAKAGDSELIRLIAQKGYLKACNRLTDSELVTWVREEAKRQSKEISGTAARKLVEIAGTRLRDIKGELDKIVLYVGEKERIEDQDVEDSGLDCREESIFNLSDAIGSKDVRTALRVYDRVSGEEPVKVLGAISRQIRTLLKIKALQRKGVPAQRYPSMLGLFPKHVDGYLKRSRQFTERELMAAIERLSTADADLKTGRVPEAVVLPRLIFELCAKQGAK